MSETELIAKATIIYEAFQDERLDASLLGQLAQWIASGDCPNSDELRAAGLTTTSTDPSTHAEWRLVRKAFTRRWGFSIPCAEAVETLKRLSPLLEVGAGTAYWSALLAHAGADILATDINPPGKNPHGFSTGCYFPTETISAVDAIQKYPTREVFCSWPTQDAEWAADAFLRIGPGRHLALVGTGRGGITGSDRLFDALENGFQLLETVALPQFPEVADRLDIFQRLPSEE